MTTVGAPEKVFLLHREAPLGVADLIGSTADAGDVVSETGSRCPPADRPDGGGAPGFGRRDEGHAESLGLLLMRERLTPVDRSGSVLRAAFDFPHAQAGLPGLSHANARRIPRRARARYGEDGLPRFVADRAVHDGPLPRLLAASATDELEPLARLVAHHATMPPLDATSRSCT